MSHAGDLAVAREAANAACALLDGAQTQIGTVRSKSNLRDLVTEWDERAEDVIRQVLFNHRPEIPILGEEGGISGKGEGARWLVDPIDGTVNFAHGLPMFGVSIALEREGRPVVGVTRAPALSWEFWATRGGGAFFNGQPMQTSAIAEISQAILATGFPYDRAETKYNFRAWEHMQCTAGACRRFGAASLDLAMVAVGWLDGFWESRLSPWDVAVGALLVEEAGGRVTDLRGGPFSSDSGQAIATNGHIHDVLMNELEPHLDNKWV